MRGGEGVGREVDVVEEGDGEEEVEEEGVLMKSAVFHVDVKRGEGSYLFGKTGHDSIIPLPRGGIPQSPGRPVLEPVQGGIVSRLEGIDAQLALQRQDNGNLQAGVKRSLSKDAIRGETVYGPDVVWREVEPEDARVGELEGRDGAGVVACEA